jgi:hypothetical protein
VLKRTTSEALVKLLSLLTLRAKQPVKLLPVFQLPQATVVVSPSFPNHLIARLNASPSHPEAKASKRSA